VPPAARLDGAWAFQREGRFGARYGGPAAICGRGGVRECAWARQEDGEVRPIGATTLGRRPPANIGGWPKFTLRDKKRIRAVAALSPPDSPYHGGKSGHHYSGEKWTFG